MATPPTARAARIRRCILTGLAPIAILLAYAGLRAVIDPWRDAPVPIRLSHATTRIVSPLHEDGTPDYAAALAARAGPDLVPADNAAALYWLAFGPEPIEPPHRREFFAELGIEVPPEDGTYLTDAPEGIPDYQHLLARPWSAEEAPQVAEWVRRNEQPLDLIVEGAFRPRYLVPIVPGDALIVGLARTHTPATQSRDLLGLRAMLRLGASDVPRAWRDLQALHRMAVHVSQGFIIDRMVAASVEATALSGSVALAHHAALPAAQALACLRELDAVPQLAKVADVADTWERSFFLDSIVHVSRLAPDEQQDWLGRAVRPRGSGRLAVDWNVPLLRANRIMDALVEIARTPDGPERRRLLDQLGEEHVAEVERRREVSTMRAALRWLAGETLGAMTTEAVGSLLIATYCVDIEHPLRVEELGAMLRELARLAFPLAAYRADHGAYPASLDLLVPAYVAALPADRFHRGRPPVYRRAEDGQGYVLYSVGPDGTDGGGTEGTSDDLVFRVPAPNERPK